MEIRVARLGKDDAKVADSLLVLGVITAESGKPVDAESMLRDSLRIRLAKVGGNKGLVGEAQCALATCLGYLRRFEEGEPLMRQGVANLRAGYGDAHTTTHQGLDEAVRFFTAADKPAAAAEFAALRPSAK